MKNKKLVGVLLAGIMTVSAVATPTAMTKFGIEKPPAVVTTMEANAASYNWRTGNFAGGTSYTSKHFFYAKKKKPKVTFYAYNKNGEQTSYRMWVRVLYDWGGTVMKTPVRSGETITIPIKQVGDYSIQVSRYSSSYPCVYWATKINSNQGWIG